MSLLTYVAGVRNQHEDVFKFEFVRVWQTSRIIRTTGTQNNVEWRTNSLQIPDSSRVRLFALFSVLHCSE